MSYASKLSTGVRDRSIPSHVRVAPPEGGLKRVSFAMTEAVRSLSKDRLLQPWGRIGENTLTGIEGWLRTIMGL